jgi:radical SAM superfamily enzyme YgiQ (UPF0313 family)
VPKTIEEINRLKNSLGVDAFFIWADTFTADNRYVLDFSKALIDKKLNVMWACNSRVDTVTPDLLKYMASAGCWMISFGIESASIDVLTRIKKKTTPAQAIQVVKWAKTAGIKTAGHFIFGMPGDSEQNIKETIDLSLGLDLDMAQFYCAVPFPGSELYEIANANGWIKTDSFADFRQDKAVMDLPGLSQPVVDYYRKTAFRRFYLRPRQLMTMLRLLRVEALGQTFRGGIRFLRWVTS